jgi:osomolarity two-component system sensor histidine kinase NIK1
LKIVNTYHPTSPPSPTMAAIPSGSLPSGLFPSDSSAFEEHILSLLSVISQQPSPAYPFPTSDSPLPTTAEIKLEPFVGEKTDAQHAIEKAIISLGGRIRESERVPSPHAVQNALVNPTNASLLTPEWTPPPGDALEIGDSPPTACPTCARSFSDQITPTSSNQAREVQPTPAGWSTNPNGGMSAEKELELLRAQVQDIARVCKVSSLLPCLRSS